MELPTDTTLELRGSRLVVRKRRLARTAAEAEQARLQTEAEARWLVAGQHPGVVALARVVPDEAMIETIHAGLGSLRTVRVGAAATIDLLLAVSDTLIELQRRGLRHGRLSAEHVVVSGGGTGHPRLCAPTPLIAGAGPAPDESDVIGLGRLASQLAIEGCASSRSQLDLAMELTDPASGISLVQARRLLDVCRPAAKRRARWSFAGRVAGRNRGARGRPGSDHGL